MSDLKPCPFCGSTDVIGVPVGKSAARMICECFAGGPLTPGGEHLDAWNSRAEQRPHTELLRVIHDDLLSRADTVDGVSVVELSSSVWQRLKAALEANDE